MIGSKSQASQRPTALGTMLQASTYGLAIPTIYGMTQSALLAIWAGHLRMGSGSTKKLKQFLKKQPVYVEGVDFLVGKNPVMGINQLWINAATIPLTVATTTVTWDGSTHPGGYAISDPHFYSIIGVTVALPYSETFNDYGGQGSVTVSGTAQVPLWNACEIGPDPTNPNSFRRGIWNYRWQPGFGATFYLDNAVWGGSVPLSSVFTVTYYQLMPATSYQSPLAKYRMAFENELGNGDEYSQNGATAEQIIYPMFAGVGSPDLDLGTSATMPQIQAEVKGKFGYWPTGDADFADMIEDIFKSGLAQAAIGASTTGTSFTGLEHGLSGYNYPGTIQKQYCNGTDGTPPVMNFGVANQAGNFLLAFAGSNGAGSHTIGDTAGNTWTPILPDGGESQAWYCQCVGGVNAVSFSGFGIDWDCCIMEIGGVDTLDSVSAGSGSVPSVTTTNQSGFPAYAIVFPGAAVSPTGASAPLWRSLFPNIGGSTFGLQSYQRIVKHPTTLNFTPSGTAGSAFVIAFKCVNPPTYPNPVGDFMDLDSLNLVRAQCAANGLYGSLAMNAQQAGSDWLKMLYQAANAAPVYLGSKLYSFPYSEVSAAGNGSVYNAPTASGPVANLSTENGDILSDGKNPPIKFNTKSRVGLDNVLQMQCISRTSNYTPVVVSQPDAASIALYGVRKDDPIVNNAVQDASIARQLLGIAVRRLQYGASDTWTFNMSSSWDMLSPMDLITISDPQANYNAVPVRLTSISEQSDGSLSCEAEPFIYGMCAPSALPVSTQTPSGPNPGVDPGAPNAPIFIEAVPRLAGNPTQNQLWIVVSSGNANYAGCQVFVSSDGGGSYKLLGDPIVGNATTGVNTADWPASANPDTTTTLDVDLTECKGTLPIIGLVDEDNSVYPCYMQGGSGSIPYELFCYNQAGLVSPYTYNLTPFGITWEPFTPYPVGAFVYISDIGQPDGLPLWVIQITTAGTSGANQPTFNAGIGNTTTDGSIIWTCVSQYGGLRRAVFGAPVVGEGCDHPSGSRFAFLSPDGTGILKVPIDPAWYGVTLYFKFVPFNSFGGNGQQTLASATPYTYAPTGNPGSIGPAGGFLVNGS